MVLKLLTLRVKILPIRVLTKIVMFFAEEEETRVGGVVWMNGACNVQLRTVHYDGLLARRDKLSLDLCGRIIRKAM